MSKFIVDLWLDGYNSEEEAEKACEKFIYEQLNFAGSGVKIKRVTEESTEEQIKFLSKELNNWKLMAESWMKDYDKLKNKYEPMVVSIPEGE